MIYSNFLFWENSTQCICLFLGSDVMQLHVSSPSKILSSANRWCNYMFPCLLWLFHLVTWIIVHLNYLFKLVQYGNGIYASITELVQRPTSATKILMYLLKLNMIPCHILFLPPCYDYHLWCKIGWFHHLFCYDYSLANEPLLHIFVCQTIRSNQLHSIFLDFHSFC